MPNPSSLVQTCPFVCAIATLPETDAIFANMKEKDISTLEGENSVAGRQVKRLGIDCKATVKIGDYSRGRKDTR